MNDFQRTLANVAMVPAGERLRDSRISQNVPRSSQKMTGRDNELGQRRTSWPVKPA